MALRKKKAKPKFNTGLLKIRHFFDASHQLPDSDTLVQKGCANLHGHTYAVDVWVESPVLVNGMIVDFKRVKDILDTLDHQHINWVFEELEMTEPTTAENVARFFAETIRAQLGFPFVRVAVCEGYKGEDRANWAVFSIGKAKEV